eukprot:TRINITY_DN7852_c0_g1_i2.p1 TRINITY_DN7852_c0_g1~~TRINITY_DN7852_c0_g1_i2.p1  ORF type:complete len:155 (+),score=35.11 TRINITY_DN7852_c0_g1_i2:524-988(+)
MKLDSWPVIQTTVWDWLKMTAFDEKLADILPCFQPKDYLDVVEKWIRCRVGSRRMQLWPSQQSAVFKLLVKSNKFVAIQDIVDIWKEVATGKKEKREEEPRVMRDEEVDWLCMDPSRVTQDIISDAIKRGYRTFLKAQWVNPNVDISTIPQRLQ